MATRRVVTIVDDLDPTGVTLADETVTFALDGQDYEIDLSSANASRLRSQLEEFRQAGRPVRRKSGTGSARARAWAIEHGLIAAEQRGVLNKKYRDAYDAFVKGDRRPFSELLAIPPQKEEGDPGWDPEGDDTPTPAEGPTALPDAQGTAAEAEVEARKHYRAITRSLRMSDPAKWARRTGYGVAGKEKIEDWSLTERIESLSDQHLKILGTLAGDFPLSKAGTVSYLKTSEHRLENLEFIEMDLASPHGWVITGFGQYAFNVRRKQIV
ncbi:Lsr2 family protein [Streptomyces sp. NPDC056500]|uniref:histone-like nucleoid-structuring protein Lsr2 n=1 Tax=Streptomyces sp. NPDC056500 TaxID=3345840 RepID=UPI00369D7DB0